MLHFIKRPKGILLFAVTAFLSVQLLSGCAPRGGGVDPSLTGQIPNQPASQISIQHAIDVQNQFTPALMKIPGVNGTGVGQEGSVPVVYIFTNRESVAGIPAKLADVATHIEYVGTVYALDETDPYKGSGGGGGKSSGFTATYRNPMWSGVSVGNDNECASGTISCVLAVGTTQYILSNNHVFARENAASLGEQIDQPGRYDTKCGPSGGVASLVYFQPISFNSGTNTVDCAIAELLTAGMPATSTAAINKYTPAASPVAPIVNMAVEKTGRTTGLTSGKIGAINVTVSVQYSASNIATFTGQIYISGRFSSAGDSGSLIVTNDANHSPVGLLFAGSSNSTFGNRMIDVMNNLQAGFNSSIAIDGSPWGL